MEREGKSGEPTSFESAWPELARRLYQVLLADGVAPALVEDAVQETGVRLFVRWGRIDKTRPLMPLAVTIARNVLVDHHRKHGRVELSAAPLEDQVSVDVEERALARIHLSAVHRAMRKLTPRYRSLLLAEAGYVGATSSGPAARTARSRARQGLNLLMERATDAAWVMTGPIVGLSRRSSFRLRQSLGRQDWVVVGQAAAGAVLFLASLGSSPFIAPESPVTSESPRLVASADFTGPSVTGVAQGGELEGTHSRSEAPRSVSDGRPGEATGSGLLPPLPSSKGHNTGEGYTGLDGFNEAGEGTGTIAGEKIDWSYRAEYRQPNCVRSALQGKPSLGCDTSPRAGAGASVKHRDREVGFDTED